MELAASELSNGKAILSLSNLTKRLLQNILTGKHYHCKAEPVCTIICWLQNSIQCTKCIFYICWINYTHHFCMWLVRKAENNSFLKKKFG